MVQARCSGVLMAIDSSTDPKWQRHFVLGDDWRIFVGPIRPDDEFRDRDLLAQVSQEDLRAPLRLGALHMASSREAGEYAILLRSDLKGRGLGWALMQLIIEYAKSKELKRIDGQILQENSVMLKMCRELGFEIKTDPDDNGVCDVALVLEGG